MTEFTTVFVSGTLYWAKVFKAVPNYDRDGTEWAFDFVPDDVSFLKDHRLLDRLKEARDPIHDDYIHIKKPSVDKNGNPNDPFIVVDSDNSPWDKGNIGNGSKADLKLTIANFGPGKKKAIWCSAIRVTEHVPHEGGTQSDDPFADMPTSKTAKAKPAKKAPSKTVLEELDNDDEIPF